MKITRIYLGRSVTRTIFSHASNLFGVTAALLPAILLFSEKTSEASSGQWNLNPINSDWNLSSNWTPATVPNGPGDTATFITSNVTGLHLSSDNEVNGITFSAGASPYTITIDYAGGNLVISGAGITNSSGITQNIIVKGDLWFYNNATAGHSQIFEGGGQFFLGNSTAGDATFTIGGDPGDGFRGGVIEFRDSSTAGNGIFTATGDIGCGSGNGGISFQDTATAGGGTFVGNGGAACFGGGGAVFAFSGQSTAANGIFTINGGGNIDQFGATVDFMEGATAGNATLIANGGTDGGSGGLIRFHGDATGGTARVELFGNGSFDVSGHSTASPLVIGSLEGSGNIFLGATELTVGSRDLSTTFAGILQDQGGIVTTTGGSLTKVGSGTLTLSGANTYTGVTTVSAGALLVTSKPSSGTGANKVKINAGTLGGTGIIGGAVTIGTGSGTGAFLAPGTTSAGLLTIRKTLTFKADATYKCELKTSTRRSDTVVAKGVIINSGALFSFIGLGSSTIPQGSVFTAINNTAATPINGRFANLADGTTFAANGNKFQVSYVGGTGNDLTFTAVP